MTNWLVLAVVTVAFVVGCQPKSKTGTVPGSPDVPSQPEAPAPIPPDSKGTSDQGGGGNLIQGKPIDFYKKEITSWPEYVKYIQPIDEKINSIRQDHQNGNGIAYLKTIVSMKTWYLVPVKIEELDKKQIGTGFQSEQAAYQTSKEIFLSDLIYKTLPEEQKAQLLLHEIVMAFYRVKYESMEFYCRAFLKTEVREGCLSAIKSGNETIQAKPDLQTEGVFLKSDEYESIRHVTEWLFSNYKTMTQKDFDGKLIEKKFDPRVFNSANFVSSYESSREQARSISIPEFLTLLKNMKLRDVLPQNCAFAIADPHLKARAICKTDFLEEGKNLRMKVSVHSNALVTKPLEKEFILTLPYNAIDSNGRPTPVVSLYKGSTKDGVIYWSSTLDEVRIVSEGLRSYFVKFNLRWISESDYTLDSIEVTPKVWISSKGGGFQTENVNLTSEEEVIHYISIKQTR